jgi:hypothetical protein
MSVGISMAFSQATVRLLCLLAAGLATVAATKSIVSRRKRNPRRLPYPPGPKGRLFVGNLAQIPRVHAWLGYHELCKEYGESLGLCQGSAMTTFSRQTGDMVHLNVIGREILVLGSMKRVTDLLNGRAVNYSDRPVVPITEL